MATFIGEVVDTTLTFGSLGLTTRGFGVATALCTHGVTTNRADSFSTAAALLEAGFSSTSPAYIMAVKAFSGSAPVERLIIGRRQMDSMTVTVTGTPAVGDVVTLVASTGVNTKTFRYTVGATDTNADILDGLALVIEADVTYAPSLVFAAAAGSTMSVTIATGEVADLGNGNMTTVLRNGVEGFVDALTEVRGADDGAFWYMADSHASADVLAMAAYFESAKRIYVWSSSDEDTINGVEGNLAQQLRELGYNYTWYGSFQPSADTIFPEAACIATLAGAPAGTSTAHGKTLVGVPLNKLTETQVINLVANNGNPYLEEHGVPFYRDGFVAGGNFVDLIQFGSWADTRLNESVMGLIKRRTDSNEKINIDDLGMAKVKQSIDSGVVNVAIRRDAIFDYDSILQGSDDRAIDLRPVISFPSRADMTDADISRRVIPDVKVEFVYKTPAHYFKLSVGVVLNRS